MDNKFASVFLGVMTITQILVSAQQTSIFQATDQTTEQLVGIVSQISLSREIISQSCSETSDEMSHRLETIEQKLNGLNLDVIESKMQHLERIEQKLDNISFESIVSETSEQLAGIRSQISASEDKVSQTCSATSESLSRLETIEQKLNSLDLESVESKLQNLDRIEQKLDNINLESIVSQLTEQLAQVKSQLSISEEKVLQSCAERSEDLEDTLLQRLNTMEQKLNRLDSDSTVSEIKSYIDQKFETPEINTYRIVYTRDSWSDARADCKSRGMDLASINSLAEREHILELMTTNSCLGFWVAAKKSDKGVWIWVNDNKPIHPNIWYWNQPDGNSNYGVMQRSYNMLLDDDGGSYCYICEST